MKKYYLIIAGAAAFIYFTYFWLNAIAYTDSGNLLIRQGNMWADWALHFTFGSAFVERGLMLAENPLLAGAPQVYPPAASWISAILVKMGIPFFTAFVLPSYFFTLGLVALLFYFFKKVLGTATTALTASALFLLNGGLGFIYYFKDIAASSSPMQALLFPPREYTDLEPEVGINFMNFLTSMIYPQRSFTTGFTLVLAALSTIFVILIKKKSLERKKRWLILGTAAVILGISPLIHPHSSLAAAIILLSWFMITAYERREQLMAGKFHPLYTWLKLGAGSLILALPISIVFYLHNVSAESFFSFNPGFLSPESGFSWPVYWLMNWGAVPFLAAGGLFVSWRKGQSAHKFLAPFLLIFAASNIWQFQPWMWDNMKLLAWSAVGVCGLAALSLRWLWQQKSPASYGLAAILFIISILSGLTETVRNIQFSNFEYTMYTSEELELAVWARENTDSSGVWLTSDRPNNWAYNLTGRQPVMAYPGWLSSHGLSSYHNLQQDNALLFAHPDKYTDLIEKHGIRYASIGPSERVQWNARPDKFSQSFSLIKETANYQIFEIAGEN